MDEVGCNPSPKGKKKIQKLNNKERRCKGQLLSTEYSHILRAKVLKEEKLICFITSATLEKVINIYKQWENQEQTSYSIAGTSTQCHLSLLRFLPKTIIVK